MSARSATLDPYWPTNTVWHHTVLARRRTATYIIYIYFKKILNDERRDHRSLPARRCLQLLPLRRRRRAVIAARCLFCRRTLHAGAGRCSAAKPAGSPLHRAATHRQRRRTAPVLPLLGARKSAKVSVKQSGRNVIRSHDKINRKTLHRFDLL